MRTLIIAEAGVNHNGSLQLAKQLVDIACEAGVDIVKFQTFKAENLVTHTAVMADYQIQNLGQDSSQFDMLKKLELSFRDFLELKAHCDQKGIEFISTPFDLESIDFLSQLNMKYWKIPSGELTNLPYLEKIAKLEHPVILSTGMATMDEVRASYDILIKNGASEVFVLHCTSDYPTQFSDVNMNAMLSMKQEFGDNIGYSDHTQGILIPTVAVSMGAKIIEKHFTISKTMEGPDHKASLEPSELKELVNNIRNIESCFGSFVKQPTLEELNTRLVARKSIMASRKIEQGETFTSENLSIKRPGSGISPMKWYEVIGQKASRSFVKDELIEL
ncbi:MAG: N-acetylneuraminate synthase [Erysipelotrichaceae bacterium]|nr:MAG: N-acetylneuraminate [Erysipelotrichaceae bacterium]TXT18468.1 MAG: N-acetylneuraminate synthase [Erysipelotrichaceae bacterium]